MRIYIYIYIGNFVLWIHFSNISINCSVYESCLGNTLRIFTIWDSSLKPSSARCPHNAFCVRCFQEPPHPITCHSFDNALCTPKELRHILTLRFSFSASFPNGTNKQTLAALNAPTLVQNCPAPVRPASLPGTLALIHTCPSVCKSQVQHGTTLRNLEQAHQKLPLTCSSFTPACRSCSVALKCPPPSFGRAWT